MKIEPKGVAGTWLQDDVQVGDHLDVSSPRGSFVLQIGGRPILLLSAGIGATPVLAMLHALGGPVPPGSVLVPRGSRWRASSLCRRGPPPDAVLAARPKLCLLQQARCVGQVRRGFNAAGHLSRSAFEETGIPQEADVYLCGPAGFMAEMKAALAAYGIPPERVQVEIFNGGEAMSPGVARVGTRNPRVPTNDANTGPLVSFARSGVAAHWNGSVYQTILELAEACDVPVRWSCRSGVCHSCESALVSGAVAFEPEPLDKPAEGNILICCAQPIRDLAIDL